jgi:hypothetical protein
MDEKELPDVVEIKETILCLQVCSRLSVEETKAWGEGRFCGTTNGWQWSDRTDQGVQCAEFPNRKHYMFDC